MSLLQPLRRRAVTCAVVAMFAVTSCSSSTDTGPTSTSTATTTTVAADTSEFAGYVRSPALNVATVALPTVKGEPLKMVAQPGGLLIVFFGYTTCPDVCPMTLSLLKVAIAEQPVADRKRVQVAMVSIDPSRDTPDKFVEYVTTYLPGALAVRSEDPVELREAANVFGADFRITQTLQGKREVSHSDDLYVIDDTGEVILAWPFGVTAAQIQADLRRLLAGERPSADP